MRNLDRDDIDPAVPTLPVIVGMPLTFNIADGLTMKLISYSALKILRGRAADMGWTVHLLTRW